MLNQYDIDKNRFIELFSKFTGISKNKISSFIDNNSIRTIFEHPTAMDITVSQREKIYQLKELKNLYNNLKSYDKEYLLDSVTKAGKYFKEYFSSIKDKELFVCSFLDNRNKIITTKVMSTGTVNEAPIYPREISKIALLYDSSSVILAHNHPSGSIMPSQADINTTKQIVNALSTLKIRVIDHIIVGDNTYTSFLERGISLFPDNNSLTNNVKDKVIKQYDKEFPAIKHISELTAKYIDEINCQEGRIVKIKEIKDMYKNIGNKLEFTNNINDVQDFRKLQNIIDDLKKAQLTEKDIQSQSNTVSQINKSVEIEIV